MYSHLQEIVKVIHPMGFTVENYTVCEISAKTSIPVHTVTAAYYPEFTVPAMVLPSHPNAIWEEGKSVNVRSQALTERALSKMSTHSTKFLY